MSGFIKKYRKIFFLPIIFGLAFFIMGNVFAPVLLKIDGIEDYMKNPEFWVKRIKNPDRVLMTDKKISALNKYVYDRGYLVHPMYERNYISRATVYNYLKSDIEWISKFKKYDKNNIRLNGAQFEKRLAYITATNNIPSRIKNRFCLVTTRTYLRTFPTNIMVMKKKDDVPFDLLQKSSLDVGQELVLFHTSVDNKWGYVQSPYSVGWVKLSDIAYTYDRTIIEQFIGASNFIQSIAAFTPVYKESRKVKVLTLLRMSSRLPFIESIENKYAVKYPIRQTNGVLTFTRAIMYKRDDVHKGYLLLTRANIAMQAFRMLGMPYSWGGQDFHTDCSSFLMRVFRTMNLELPRSSITQVKLLGGIDLTENKSAKLDKLKPFSSVLYHAGPGHIMLYLGRINNKYYVIHNKWSYYEVNNKTEREILVKQVIVSDLSLGEEHYKGSLYEKLKLIGYFD